MTRPKNEALWKLRAHHTGCFLENDIPFLATRAAAGLIDCWADGGHWAGARWMLRRAVEHSWLKVCVSLYVWRARWFGYDPEGMLDHEPEADDGA